MKNIIALYLLFACCSSFSVAQETEPQPVLHLSFNGSVVDSSGINSSIEVSGGEFAEDRNGNANSAYYFDGNSSISIKDTGSKLDEISNTDGVTFMSWINVEEFPETTSRSIILERYDDFKSDYWESDGYHFGINNTGQLHIRARNSTNNSTLYQLNEWIHVAVTLKGGTARFFVNGELFEEKEGWLKGAGNSVLTIGNTQFSDQAFIGWLDEVKVFDQVVTDNVIRINADKRPIYDERIFHLPFTGTIADSGTVQQSLYEYSDGKKGDGNFIADRHGNNDEAFKMADSGRVIKSANTDLYKVFDNQPEFSLSAWIYIESYPTDRPEVLLQMKNERFEDNPGFSLELNTNGRLDFFTANETVWGVHTIPQNQWVHISAVFDGNSRMLYVNGNREEINRNGFSSIPDHMKNAQPGILYVGGAYEPGYNYRESADEISVYNYALSESEIQSQVDYTYSFDAPGNSLLVYFPFEGLVEEQSDIGNEISINGGSLSPDRFQNQDQAYYLESDHYFTIHDTNNRLDSLYKGLTLSTWVNADSFGAADSKTIIFSRVDQEKADNFRMWLYNDSNYSIDNRLYFSINGKKLFKESIDISRGHWIHLAATFDGDTLKTYLNGELFRKSAYETSLSLTKSDLYIGGKPTYAEKERGFAGSLDEVRVYNYALPDSAIQAFYDLNKEGRRFEKKELVYLPFNGPAVDSTENPAQVELNGAVLSRGRFEVENTAYNFRDNTDAIIINNTSKLDSIYAGLTLNMWLKFDEYPADGQRASFIQKKDISNYGQFYLGYAEYGYRLLFKINSATLTGFVYPYIKRGQWFLLTATFENSVMKLYLNGNLIREGSYSGRINLDPSDIFIGNSKTLNEPFNGSIDELSIYNFALSEDSISNFYEHRFKGYNLEERKALHLQFQEEVNDSTGINSEIVQDGGQFVQDRKGSVNSALNFDGIDDRIVIKDLDTELDSVSTGLTIASWVLMGERPSDYPGSSIISRRDDEYDQYFLGIVDNYYGSWQNHSGYGEYEGVLFRIDDAEVKFRDIAIQPGSWFHVAGTFDGQELKLYVNGDHVNTSSYDDGIIRVTESDTYIGNNAAGDQPFKGTLDEVKVYNYALSDSAIAAMIDIETVGVPNEEEPEIPSKFSLSQNYPNPFNPVTNIQYVLPEAAGITLEVYNSLGQRVATLIDARKAAGRHIVSFDASYLSSGLYIYKLEFNGQVKTRKMLLIK